MDCLTVCEHVVEKGLCIGCGVCAGVCPYGNLSIIFNERGEYIAVKQRDDCCTNCGLCLKVCPFMSGQLCEDEVAKDIFGNVTGIAHTPETGYYLDAFVGYSSVDGHRENGASGGLATCILERLLLDQQVDSVACVSPTKKCDRIFEYIVTPEIKKIRRCSKSCYYPVEMSHVLKHIIANEGKYAIIALPCVCKAIRFAMKYNPKLARRIKFVLGLVCGQTKSKCFAEYVTAIAGGNAHYLKEFTFRLKRDDQPASNFGMKYKSLDSKGELQDGMILWSEGIGFLWSNRFFTVNACNFCDDVFAELADICFFDAWLPAYLNDSKGNSIALVRNRTLLKMTSDLVASDDIVASSLSVNEVIKSQKSVLTSKRAEMRVRIKAATKKSKVIPNKRLHLCRQKIPYIKKKLALIRYLVSQEASHNWVISGKDVTIFRQMCSPMLNRLNKIHRLYKLTQLPTILKAKVFGK